jgi:hypothetical protein
MGNIKSVIITNIKKEKMANSVDLAIQQVRQLQSMIFSPKHSQN